MRGAPFAPRRGMRQRQPRPAATVFLVAALAASSVLVRGAAAPEWVTAWGTSLEAVGTTTITNRTVRMIARVTAGGSSGRIRPKHTFNTLPVTIGQAYLGYQLTTRSGDSAAHGAAIVPGSNH